MKNDNMKVKVYIDLGLHSGTLWATCNVGAAHPEDEGDYFAWGETKPKSNYDWSTYKYGNNVDQLSKYCNNKEFGENGYTDTKTELDPEDDAAITNWGSDWRIPTKDEIFELINVCQWEWITVNGKSGYRVTGPNDNSIFLPATSYHYHMKCPDADSYTSYLSNSVGEYPYYNYHLLFSADRVRWDYDIRSHGSSVRPVFNNKAKRYKYICDTCMHNVDGDCNLGYDTCDGVSCICYDCCDKEML